MFEVLSLLFLLGINQPQLDTSYLQSYLSTYANAMELTTQYVFVGDSRFVGMSQYETNKDTFICKVGQGLNYFKKSQDEILELDGYNVKIIIGFGVNDLANIDDYISYVNSLHLKGSLYFLTVNPIDEARCRLNGYTLTNLEIDEFNDKLKANAYNYKIIDTNEYLMEDGFDTVDGLHYNDETYEKIYKFIKKNS